MDPDSILEELRELSDEALSGGSDPEYLADQLAEKIQELDEWLSEGGRLPEEWDHSQI